MHELSSSIDAVLGQVAEREARDAAPGDAGERADQARQRWDAWRERWKGLCGWFLSSGNEPPQAELLRGRARAAIPQLLGAIAAMNERRSGRSDRSADFRVRRSRCIRRGISPWRLRTPMRLRPAPHGWMRRR